MKPGGPYAFARLPRKDLDKLLALMIKADGGNRFYSAPIYSGVRLGGWWSFDEMRDRRKPAEDPGPFIKPAK